jgi:hypothetical protein
MPRHKTGPDAAVFAAIANFKSVSRQHAAAERAFRKLCEAHPELADTRPRIEVGIDRGEVVYAYCLTISNVTSLRRGPTIGNVSLKEWKDACPGHKKARRATGITRANLAASNPRFEKLAALGRVQRAKAGTLRGVIAQSRCIAAYMAAEIASTAQQRAEIRRSIREEKACPHYERYFYELTRRAIVRSRRPPRSCAALPSCEGVEIAVEALRPAQAAGAPPW